MAANGRLNTAALTKVQGSMVLEKRAGAAFLALKAAAKKELGRTISIAAPGGAYRSFAVQDEMYRASRGDVRLARKWSLNPHSSVPLAPPGNSSHGFGTRVDIVGTAIDGAFKVLAARFGFTLEFGPRDPNHFIHDGRVVRTSVVKKVAAKVTAARPVTYTVVSGDTASAIASRYHLTLDRLGDINPSVKDLNKIHPGQKLRVG